MGSDEKKNLFSASASPHRQNMADCEMVCTLGGDGTFLKAAKHVAPLGIPILGMNMGRMGFLAHHPKEKLKEAFEAYFAGRYEHDLRSIVVPMTKEGAHFTPIKHMEIGLNEFAILRRDLSAMIGISCYVDEVFLGKIWSDGLLIATPTGSTAYSMSCGGPISMPLCKHLILTPINPHNMNVRSVILREDSVLRFKVDSNADSIMISVDAGVRVVTSQTEFMVKKGKFYVDIIRFSSNSFIKTLQEKLGWGMDIRN